MLLHAVFFLPYKDSVASSRSTLPLLKTAQNGFVIFHVYALGPTLIWLVCTTASVSFIHAFLQVSQIQVLHFFLHLPRGFSLFDAPSIVAASPLPHPSIPKQIKGRE